jgi:arsenical pump membrane protein
VVVEYLVLRALFQGDLAHEVAEPVTTTPPAPVVALAVVGATVAGFGVTSLLDVSPVWPAVAAVGVLGTRQLARHRLGVRQLVEAGDLPFALFVLGLAVVVEAVLHAGVAGWLDDVLPHGAELLPLLAMAGVAALVANVLNNLPATLALLPAAAAAGPGPALAMLIGVNVGPNLTYVGSLANLLWRRVIGRHAPSASRFSAVGVATVPLTLLAATTALWAALQV